MADASHDKLRKIAELARALSERLRRGVPDADSFIFLYPNLDHLHRLIKDELSLISCSPKEEPIWTPVLGTLNDTVARVLAGWNPNSVTCDIGSVTSRFCDGESAPRVRGEDLDVLDRDADHLDRILIDATRRQPRAEAEHPGPITVAGAGSIPATEKTMSLNDIRKARLEREARVVADNERIRRNEIVTAAWWVLLDHSCDSVKTDATIRLAFSQKIVNLATAIKSADHVGLLDWIFANDDNEGEKYGLKFLKDAAAGATLTEIDKSLSELIEADPIFFGVASHAIMFIKEGAYSQAKNALGRFVYTGSYELPKPATNTSGVANVASIQQNEVAPTEQHAETVELELPDLCFEPNAISYGGRRATLTGKAREALKEIAESRSKFMTRVALRGKIWSDDSLSDDAVVSNAISDARKALQSVLNNAATDPLPIRNKGTRDVGWQLELPAK